MSSRIYDLNRRRSLIGKAKVIYDSQVKSTKKKGHPPMEYNKKEFVDWLISQPEYLKLHKAWVKSGYDMWLAPSCDRLDDYLGYTFKNLRIVTWKVNYDKGNNDTKSGINNKRNKAVVKLRLNQEFVEELHSLAEALRVTGVRNIGQVCSGNRPLAGGFKWMFKEDYEKLKIDKK